LFDLAQGENWAEAYTLQAKLDNIAQVFQRNHTLGQSLAALKFLMHHIGLCEPFVLPPLQTLNGQHSLTTEALIRQYQQAEC
jgi:4-hydroxy-tetrahydrodipicolinate synthase